MWIYRTWSDPSGGLGGTWSKGWILGPGPAPPLQGQELIPGTEGPDTEESPIHRTRRAREAPGWTLALSPRDAEQLPAQSPGQGPTMPTKTWRTEGNLRLFLCYPPFGGAEGPPSSKSLMNPLFSTSQTIPIVSFFSSSSSSVFRSHWHVAAGSPSLPVFRIRQNPLPIPIFFLTSSVPQSHWFCPNCGHLGVSLLGQHR